MHTDTAILALQQTDTVLTRAFASNNRGRASCIIGIKHGGDILKYTLRFDQHPRQPFVHMDFSFYHEGEHKLISHRLYYFNYKLFFAIMFAGLFDGYFNTLIDSNLKGIQELRKRNPAFLCSLTQVWLIETAMHIRMGIQS
jgi:hypothetical protein